MKAGIDIYADADMDMLKSYARDIFPVLPKDPKVALAALALATQIIQDQTGIKVQKFGFE